MAEHRIPSLDVSVAATAAYLPVAALPALTAESMDQDQDRVFTAYLNYIKKITR
jgi:hypothetical protein